MNLLGERNKEGKDGVEVFSLSDWVNRGIIELEDIGLRGDEEFFIWIVCVWGVCLVCIGSYVVGGWN